MPTKLFKPGEYAYYGHCRITINGDEIKVEWMDWGKTEVKETRTFSVKADTTYSLPIYLEEQSTHYWADTMMDWVKKNCNYETPSMFAGGW